MNETGCFAKAVPYKGSGRNLVFEQVILGRKHNGNAGFVLRGVNGAVANSNTGDVGNLVQGAFGHGANLNAVIFNSFLFHIFSPLSIK